MNISGRMERSQARGFSIRHPRAPSPRPGPTSRRKNGPRRLLSSLTAESEREHPPLYLRQGLSRGRAERIHTQNHTHPHPHPHPYPHTHACAVRELTHTHKDANTHTTGSHARTRHAHAHTRTFRTQHARTHARTRERTPAGPLRRRKWTKGGCSVPFVRAAVVRHRHPLMEDIRSATSSLSRSCAHTRTLTQARLCVNVFVFASAWERAGSVSSQRSRPLTVGTGAGPRMTGARGGAGGGRGWQGPGRAGRVQKTDGCCCRFRMVEKTGKHE